MGLPNAKQKTNAPIATRNVPVRLLIAKELNLFLREVHILRGRDISPSACYPIPLQCGFSTLQ